MLSDLKVEGVGAVDKLHIAIIVYGCRGDPKRFRIEGEVDRIDPKIVSTYLSLN